MRARLLHILFGLGLLASPALAAATPPAPQPAKVNATPAMWTVHGPKGTAYLLGSVHVLPKNVNWQTPQIQAAMKAADTFVFEVPMDKDTQARAGAMFGAQGLLPFSTSLPALLDSETRADFRQAVMLTGADTRLLVYMRPWLAGLTLQGATMGASGFSSEEGVDNKVYALATARGVKSFRAFETPEMQINLLQSFSKGGPGELASFGLTLKQIIKQSSKKSEDGIDVLVAAWEKGDTARLARLSAASKEMPPEARKMLLEDRNRAWVPQLAKMLAERRTYFVTVGAGHLVGNAGVPTLLRQAGYKVEGP